MSLYMYQVASHGTYLLLQNRLGRGLILLLNFPRLFLPLLLIFVERPLPKEQLGECLAPLFLLMLLQCVCCARKNTVLSTQRLPKQMYVTLGRACCNSDRDAAQNKTVASHRKGLSALGWWSIGCMGSDGAESGVGSDRS